MINPNELPPVAENKQETHRLESAAVGMPGSATEVVVSIDGKDIAIKPFDERNIDAILIKLLKENEQSSQGVNINESANISAKINEKKKKIEEDIQNLKNIFNTANNEIFLVREESMKDLPEKLDLCVMIIANKSKDLQANLEQKGYSITPDGNKGFWAESKNNKIKMYFLFGKERHQDENQDKKKEKLAA